MADDIVTRLRDRLEESFCHCVDDPFFVCSYCAIEEAGDEIERLRAERDETQDSLELWRSLANALTRDLAFRTDDKTADFIVQQMVARIYRERAVRGE